MSSPLAQIDFPDRQQAPKRPERGFKRPPNSPQEAPRCSKTGSQGRPRIMPGDPNGYPRSLWYEPRADSTRTLQSGR
eukprot:7157955-Pyramimonas_sp.AAC.1